MSKKVSVVENTKRGPGRPRGPVVRQNANIEQAAAYGVSLPEENFSNGRFISPNDVGKILNVTGEAVKQWIYRRKLPAVKLANGYWKIKVADFEAFVKARIEVGKLQIIITDGLNSDCSEVLDAIKHLDHQFILAHNYSDALLKALDHIPALFIVCIHLGDPECWKFTEKIRSHKLLRRIPILFIAGQKISDDDIERAVNFNAQGILTRPLNVETIKNEISRILSRP